MRWRDYPYWHETILAVLIVGLLGSVAILDPSFVTWATQIGLASDVWELALLALPMTLIIITAGIDLSVGSTMALSAVVLGMTFQAGANPWVAALCGMLAGTACGLFNGLAVARLNVHPLIVTLATLAAFRGVAEGISLGRPISGFPESFTALGTGTLAGVPIPGLIFAVLAILTTVALARTPTGLALYAIGHNPVASRWSGLPVARLTVAIYALAGTIAGLAAAIYVARRNTAKADIGTGLELDVITAVVLGGTSIFGGSGRIVGTLLGVLAIHETRKFVGWYWEREELNVIVVGVLLIAAVLLNRLVEKKAR
jgi:rhamnose transport system permease protein